MSRKNLAYTSELKEAFKSIFSTLSKCEKAFEKLKQGTPQHTLLKKRIDAFRIALALIEAEIDRSISKGESLWQN